MCAQLHHVLIEFSTDNNPGEEHPEPSGEPIKTNWRNSQTAPALLPGAGRYKSTFRSTVSFQRCVRMNTHRYGYRLQPPSPTEVSVCTSKCGSGTQRRLKRQFPVRDVQKAVFALPRVLNATFRPFPVLQALGDFMTSALWPLMGQRDKPERGVETTV